MTKIAPPLAGKLLVVDTLALTWKTYTYKKQMQPIVPTLTYQELKELPEVELIDVRELEEREQEHLGGRHIPCKELPAKLHTLDPHKPIVVYCQHGVRSAWAAQLIRKHFQIENVFSLEGGLAHVKELGQADIYSHLDQ